MNERKNAHRTKGALRILEALGGVDQDLLARSGAPDTSASSHTIKKVTDMSDYRKRYRLISVFGRTVAACLVFVIAGLLSWNGLRLILVPKGTSGSGSDTDGTSGYNQSSFYDEVTGDMVPQTGPEMDGESNMDGNESAPQFLEDLQEEQATGNANPEEAPVDNGGSGSGKEEEARFQTEEEKDMEKGSENSTESSLESITDQDLHLFSSRKLTEGEARGLDLVGGYIPSDIPDGYTFESAWTCGQDSVTVTWLRGMDSMMVTVSCVVSEDLETVDVGKPEAYDRRLYETPYGETVPVEYIETFQDPLFAYGDLSLEVVGSRMIPVEDAGDTDTPRGNFSVLYPEDGVLLHFNGQGTAEEIWNMLQISSFSRMR